MKLIICFLFLSLSIFSEVIDTAGMFSPSVVSSQNFKLSELKSKFKKELIIETFEELNGANAENLALEKAKARKVNGVYVLISKKEKRIVIQVGNQTKNLIGSFETSTLKAKFIEEFKAKNFDRGLVSSVDYYSSIFENAGQNRHVEKMNPTLAPRDTNKVTDTSSSSFTFILGLIFFGILFFLIIRFITSLFTSRPKNTYSAHSQHNPHYDSHSHSSPGFFGTFLTGMFGAVAGNWIYDKFFDNNSGGVWGSSDQSNNHSNIQNNDSYSSSNSNSWSDRDTDYSSDSGSWSDSSSSDSSWDSGSSSDSGGGDSGGGDW
jgi:uncharacterized protein